MTFMLKNQFKTAQKHIKHQINNLRPKAKKTVRFIKKNPKQVFILVTAAFFIFCGLVALWISTFQLPDLQSFDTRKTSQSTKIYDRTGKILLYDVFENVKRTQVSFEEISRHIKNATVAIEDAEFYEHNGIKITSFIRAVFANIGTGSFSQGGSTITQQVIKNSLLTTEKRISRKIKEWVLALRLEKVMLKEEILSIYLNENPYGGTIYGVEEASNTFFGKKASEVTLAEAAYLASIPKAPTFYSPYRQNKDKLDERQQLVLAKMLENNFISQEEYEQALNEEVIFLPQEKYGIKAPHFVEFVRQYLIDKYGDEALREKGLRVITTLDYELQEKTEEIAKAGALANKEKFDAENIAVVILDPKTGEILTMVGSRYYFDKEIDGQFNVTTAKNRQPGSTFKPFVYATAFSKGYTPDTVVFDLPTEFQTTCTPEGLPKDLYAPISSSTECYMPENYDGIYVGPISLRNALAQSRNIPAIKTLYLAGMKDSINTAKTMGLTTLSDDPNQYGLTLVLGGGEVSLLEMASAYGVFANDGVRNPYIGILKVEDLQGNTLYENTPTSKQVIQTEVARTISDVLSDKNAKIPAYGLNSPLFFSNYNVASKTGTTNDYKDAWTIGYTPEVVVGTWVGNNDSTPMQKKVAGMIVAPIWHNIMEVALTKTSGENFKSPSPVNPEIKPALRGIWQGNETYFIDIMSGKLATEMTPPETKMEIAIPNLHTILHWVNKQDPLGPAPIDPTLDSQYEYWEYGIQKWLLTNPQISVTQPTTYDDVHTEANKPKVSIISPLPNVEFDKDHTIVVALNLALKYPASKAYFYFNNELLGVSETYPFVFNFVPSGAHSFNIGLNELKVIVYDNVYNKGEASMTIKVK